MVRFALFACLLGLLAAAPASARPATGGWRFWFSKPERHGQRKLAGDFTHINTTYRYHSRERQGPFSFLHLGSQRPNTARHKSAAHRHTGPARNSHKRTSGLF